MNKSAQWIDKNELLAGYRTLLPTATMCGALRAVTRHGVRRRYPYGTSSRPQLYNAEDWQQVLSFIKPRSSGKKRRTSAEPPPAGWHRLRDIAFAAGAPLDRINRLANRGCFSLHFFQTVRYADPDAVIYALCWRRTSFCLKFWTPEQLAKRLDKQQRRGLVPPPGTPYPAKYCVFAPELIKK